MSENHDAKAIIKVVEKLHRAELVSLTHGSSEAAGVLVMPQGMKVETIKRFLDEYRLAPERNKGSVAFSRLASFYEAEVDQTTQNMASIVEPVLMLFIGLAVGTFAVSMLAPIYNLIGTV